MIEPLHSQLAASQPLASASASTALPPSSSRYGRYLDMAADGMVMLAGAELT